MEFYEGLHPLQKWQQIKQERARLLAESDWSVMPDSPLSEGKKQEYKKYRQDLRNLPQNFSNPDDVIFPSLPEK